ncbi:MAG: hypothetical protein AAF297_05015 [Planctomycetota bacterium]
MGSLAALPSVAESPPRVLAVEGDLVPDRPDGLVYDSFVQLSSLSDEGVVVYEQDFFLFVDRPGEGPRVLLERGDTQRFRNRPGVLEYRNFRFPQFARSGGFATRAGLFNLGTGTGNDQAIVYDPNDGTLPTLVAWEGQPAHDAPGRSYTALWPFRTPVHTGTYGRSVADGSIVGYTGSFSRGRGVYRWEDGDTTKIAATDDPVPGMPTGTVFGVNMPYEVSMSTRGDFAFIAPVDNPDLDADAAVMAYSSSTGLSTLAYEGLVVPGHPDGLVYDAFSERGFVSVNSSGDVAFAAGLSGTNAVVTVIDGATSVAAIEGGPVPGVPGAVFATLSGELVLLSADNSVVFAASITDATGTRAALCRVDSSEVAEVVVAIGDAAPGFPTGFTLAGFTVRNPVITESGRLAFRGEATNGSVTVSCVYAYDPTLGVRLAAFESQVLDMNTGPFGPADPRPIGELGFFDDYLINDAGRVALELTFAGSGQRRAIASFDPFRCTIGDIAEPYDQLDLSDIDAFIVSFLAGTGDLVRPFGMVDMADVDAFINGYLAGCP